MTTGHSHTKTAHRDVINAIVHICAATGHTENATEAMEAVCEHINTHGADKTLEMLKTRVGEERANVFASLTALQNAVDNLAEPVSHKAVAWMQKNPGICVAVQKLAQHYKPS